LLTSLGGQDNYLDAYLRVIRDTDPQESALVFSCGMGAGRTTFAMVAACIIRRKQLLNKGLEDPYIVTPFSGSLSRGDSGSGSDSVSVLL
jgi:hypothetical protein